MAVKVLESRTRLTCEVLEPGAPDKASYPRPALHKTGRTVLSEFRTIVLENDWTVVTIVPDLGGRVHSVLDKRTGSECLCTSEPLMAMARDDGILVLPDGFQLSVGSSLQTGMGPVSFQSYDPSHEESSAGVLLFGLTREGVDWSLCASLRPSSSALLVEVRIHNRQLVPVDVRASLLVDRCGSTVRDFGHSVGLWRPDHGCGLAIAVQDGHLESVSEDQAVVQIGLAPWLHAFLGPRATQSHTIELSPVTGLSSLDAFSEGVAVSVQGGRVGIQADSKRHACKIFVNTGPGDTLEATADLHPQVPFAEDLGVPVTGLAVRDAEGRELVRLEEGKPSPTRPNALPSEIARTMLEAASCKSGESQTLERQFFSALQNGTVLAPVPYGLEAVAALQRAMSAMKSTQYKECRDYIDISLMTNSEDQLTWWLRAVADRLSDTEEEERTSLLNARFLAPLDPVLRAEAYLATPIAPDALGASPLVFHLAEEVDSLYDVLGLLIGSGLVHDAARLINECLQHRESAMVRYLYTACLLESSTMTAEVSEQVRRAGLSPLEPPFPFRPFEVRSIRLVARRFPDDPQIQSLIQMIDEFVPDRTSS